MGRGKGGEGGLLQGVLLQAEMKGLICRSRRRLANCISWR